ncbi:MAG: magnesium transporter [Alphaproteobacteria bacterium]
MAAPTPEMPLKGGAVAKEVQGLYGLTPDLVTAILESLDAEDRARLEALIVPLHAADKADLLEMVTAEQRRTLVEVLRPELDPEILADLDETVRDEVIDRLSTAELAAAVKELDTDDAVYVIEDLDDEEKRVVLDAIPAHDRVALEEGLTYPENSAGRLMQRDLVAAPANWTVGQTIDDLRESEVLPDEFYEIFVVDPKRQPVGTIPLDRLLRTKRPVELGHIMDEAPKLIPGDMDQEEVAYLFSRYRLTSAAVVDELGRLMGVITFDDVVEVIEEEAEEDLMRLGGVAETDLREPLMRTTRNRFSWLLVNLMTAILASIVIWFFDSTIERIVALAVLMPIVASMGGNAGTQTMTVAVRALATKDLTPTNALRAVAKEVTVGGVNGVLFALLMGTIAWLWYRDPMLSVVIAAAMILTMLVAGLAGAVIPLLLSRARVDPAIAAGTFLTTVTDVVGFFVFLGLGALILL